MFRKKLWKNWNKNIKKLVNKINKNIWKWWYTYKLLIILFICLFLFYYLYTFFKKNKNNYNYNKNNHIFKFNNTSNIQQNFSKNNIDFHVYENSKVKGNKGENFFQNWFFSILPKHLLLRNVHFKKNNKILDFAIKIRLNQYKELILPIDIKTFTALINKKNNLINQQKSLTKKILKQIEYAAKDISKKYLHVYETTNFGILYVPNKDMFSILENENNFFSKIYSQYNIIILSKHNFQNMIFLILNLYENLNNNDINLIT